jgi:hypothetical protein
MSRIVRFGLLGLVCALPLALPQSSEAARRVTSRSCYTGRCYTVPYRTAGWHHHRHGHRHYRHCR